MHMRYLLVFMILGVNLSAAYAANQQNNTQAMQPDVAVFFDEEAEKAAQGGNVDNKIKPITSLPPADIENTPPVEVMPVIDWSADAINSAQWSADIVKGQLPIFLKIQILLHRQHVSPGAFDGATGRNMMKAIAALQVMNGLTPVDGKMSQPVWDLLGTSDTTPVMTTYTLTSEDVDADYPATIPTDYALQAKMPSLAYTSVVEMLGERFHIDAEFLKKINPTSRFNKAGDIILVPMLGEADKRPIKLLVAIKNAGELYGFDDQNKMIAAFPATVGSDETPSPTGLFTIKVITPLPWYSYDPKNFIQGNNLKPLRLPPGPNNPVGLVWMGLSKPSFGIHGTPSPSKIDKTRSHGCVRLANWDAQSVAKRVAIGTQVLLK